MSPVDLDDKIQILQESSVTRVLSSINFARNSTSDLIMSGECRCILLNRTSQLLERSKQESL
jgi:hypothetical protein